MGAHQPDSEEGRQHYPQQSGDEARHPTSVVPDRDDELAVGAGPDATDGQCGGEIGVGERRRWTISSSCRSGSAASPPDERKDAFKKVMNSSTKLHLHRVFGGAALRGSKQDGADDRATDDDDGDLDLDERDGHEARTM